MKNIGKRTLSMLMAALMVLSLVAVPAWNAQAEESDPHLLYEYDYSKFLISPEDNIGEDVADADASKGTARAYTGEDLSGGLSAYRYNGSAAADKQYLLLGEVASAQIGLNEGYRSYSFTATIPEYEDGEGAFVYFTGSWRVRLTQMAKDLKNLAGQKVTIVLTMKVTGTLDNATVYVDNAKIVTECKDSLNADGTACTLCGKAYVDETLPTQLQSINPKHITRYGVANFSTENAGSIVKDADSLVGNAYCATGLALGRTVDVYRYAASGTTAAQQYINLMEIPAADVKMNAGYQVYKGSITVPADIVSGNFVYVDYAGWKALNGPLAAELMNYAGKKVDIYLSMKVVGNASSADMYIDQMFLVDSCENYKENYACSICGKSLLDQTLPVELQKLDDRHITRYSAQANFKLDGGGSIVADADAYTGKAFYSAGRDLGGWFEVYRYAGSANQYINILEIPASSVKFDGQYNFYKKTTTIPENIASPGTYTYVDFGGWICQNYDLSNDLVKYAGKTVDFYISMKAVGDADSSEVYIDQMILVDSCENYKVDYACSICGKSLVDETLPEELQKLDAQHITRYQAEPNFRLDGGGFIIEDAEAYSGMAFYAADRDLGNWFDVYRYGRDTTEQYVNLLSYPADEVQMNVGYVFYKSTVTLPDSFLPGVYSYVDFGGWICQNYELSNDLVNYAGKTVDFYISMKVDGDADSAEIYIDQMILVDRCENYWDEGTVTQQPTAEEDGIIAHTCSACGAAGTEIIPKLVPAKTWNLVLDGNIAMNFVVNVTEAQKETATIDITVNGVTTTKNVADLADGVVSIELAAAQMADEITLTLNSDGLERTKTYSVRAYADIILAGDYTAETQNLVKAMLAYGAASQTFFDYNTANLANAGLTVEAASVPTTGGEMDISGSVSGLEFYGASLVHENKIAIRFYFSGSIDGLTFSQGEAMQKGDMYYIEIADICPQDMDQDMVISVTDGTDTLTITYSALDYIIRMYAKGGNTAPLVQSLYGYYVAAEAYAN